ncbi:pantothenate synthetase [Thermosyntropha lipolytica DSM 11003]|uniref:Pantothenate synthetase n=1 Tax=Thermosyntropha lipolytica DSM 11003 TaxID=1123382 RepID=A0A1M5JUH8_9FIRM|nr:pantoate--beta-alanine ligase [Thermosyntropha lipolytica]SHG44227.1 pantothenate synthetase [Thermosyntropha lipolytica DSM 11003]
MRVIERASEMQTLVLNYKKEGKIIGLVPTMGYLHAGHMALVKKARAMCDLVIVSIFVNPIQFGQGEDFDIYPRDLERDLKLLIDEEVDFVFHPAVGEMYPPGYSTYVEVEGEITSKMCGASRPGHFRGVTTVVSKLFHICLPDYAFFGQKDAQQVTIIEKMVRELNFPVKIVRVPIVREEDGLAMSSRNVYLNPQEREDALVLYRALKHAEKLIAEGERDVDFVKQEMEKVIKMVPYAVIDYIEIVRAEDLGALDKIEGQVLLALAVKIGKTRLIDNLLVEV